MFEVQETNAARTMKGFGCLLRLMKFRVSCV